MSCSDLKPCRTSEEAKKRGRNGGLASGEARRKKKALRELVQMALQSKYDSSYDHELDGKTYAEALAVKLVRKATAGDMAAIKMVFCLEGELNPKENEDAELVDA